MVKCQPDAEGLDEGTTADDMYLIRFEGDALEITAWGHEVCQLILRKLLLTHLTFSAIVVLFSISNAIGSTP